MLPQKDRDYNEFLLPFMLCLLCLDEQAHFIEKEMKIQPIVILIAFILSVWMLIAPPVIFTSHQVAVAAVCLVTITFWATGIIPPHITSLCFFVVCLVFSLAKPGVVFSGFSSSAIWLIFGGLVLGAAITSTGLGKRVGRWIAYHLQGAYLKIIGGLVVSGVCFSFLMPSAMGRIVLLIPLAVAIADYFGFEPGSNGRTGIVLAVILGSFLPAFAILPANVPNMVLIGISESLFHISLLYGPYFLLHFPVLGLLKGIIIVVVIVRLYPDMPVIHQGQKVGHEESLSRDEKILSITLLVLLGLWMTDFLHHIGPAWVALTGAVFLMLPGIGVVDKKMFNQKVNWASIIFVAGILGLGTVINRSGVGHSLASRIIAFLPLEPDNAFCNFYSLSLAATATGMATTLPAMPAVFTQFSGSLAKTAGLPLKSIIGIQVLGFSTVLLPYQAPPIVVGMQLAGERFSHAAKVCLVLAAITISLLFPLDFLWWKFLGKI